MGTPATAERRRALVVANARYDDDGLDRLASPARDAAALAGVLGDPARCGFEVATVVDADAGGVAEAVEGFLAEAERTDLLLLYFSCHGLKDEHGRLYFAARNTRRNRLRSTAVSAAVVNELLLGSRSRRKVLLLDCCYGGAFAKGLQVKADPSVHTADQFDARGLVVLTASDATQYAFDGDTIRGSATPSRFTAVLVDGLGSGRADLDGDGLVTVDDAYDFVRRRLAEDEVPQSPRKWEFDVAGHIVLGRSEAAGGGAAPPPAVLAAPRAAPVATRALFPTAPAWWLGALALVAACAAAAWLFAGWALDLLASLPVKAEYYPDFGAARWGGVVLAAAWAVAYAVVAPRRAGAGWDDAWRPPLAAYRDLLAPRSVRTFIGGLLGAVPVNVVALTVAAVGAAALAYARSGSTARDDVFELAFVVLSAAGLLWYVKAGLRARR